MFPKQNPTDTAAWKALSAHFNEMKPVHLKQLFAKDPQRFTSFSVQTGEILFDYSKNNLNEQTRTLLLNWPMNAM